VQGCCPLKILESMAAGVPVISSDLEVVRELGRHEEHFLLVKPGSVDQIAAAALRLCNEPQFAAALAERAREHVLANFTWDRAAAALRAAYREFGINLSSTAAS
jgi:glycosyltransferase involved in cell wall biosynthesis